MWKKWLVIFFLFYFFALMQNSFFIHFNLFGAVPNLVFVFFFLIAFWAKDSQNYQVMFWAIIAGFFLDVFSYTYTHLGVSIVLLIVIGFLLKKTQSLLINKGDSQPFVYFFPLFLFYFIVYEIIIKMSFNWLFIAGIVYNLFFAMIGFWIFKKITAHAK